MNWSYAWAIEAGRGKSEPQDACIATCSGDAVILAVADGAGSTLYGGIGARIACDLFPNFVPSLLACETEDEALEVGRTAISAFAEAIGNEAGRVDRPASDYATTFLGVVADRRKTVTLQVGDGAAVVGKDACLTLAALPHESEFVNVTRFVTDADAVDHLRVGLRAESIDRICAFTDGLMPLIVNERTREPHRPFFDRLFSVLDLSAGTDYDERASAWLSRMLAGESVQKRTDDDTSIVMARLKA